MTADNISKIPLPGDPLPPLPAAGEIGPHVCEIIRLYLAVLPDLSLTPEQQAIIEEHVRACAACAEEWQLLNVAENLIASLGKSETVPSARVDQAVMAVIAMRAAPPVPAISSIQSAPLTPLAPATIGRASRQRQRPRGSLFRLLSQLAVAAILLLALLATIHFATNVQAPSSAFALPANLTWNGYVLYYTQSEVDAHGETYEVQSYHEISTGNMHVEMTMPGQMDVVVVKVGQQMLGEDMMHHVAQWNPQGWVVDDSVFDLAALKSELQSHRAIYLGKETFHGQPVYEIRLSNGQVLLLNMRYQPVNVLQSATGSGAATPMYTTVQLIPAQQVPDSMWSTQIPSGFHMGELPPGP
ncbi:MAG TPA: hypothetical protein VKV40_01125 [Ktedonobacteraceae bacterium]|nr:hypothetical protein [Ktedonobacteraceae bacterium]